MALCAPPKLLLLPGPKEEPTHQPLPPGAGTPEDEGRGGAETGGLTLITEGPFPGSPLEALDDAVLHGAEKSLVHLRRTQGSFRSDPGDSQGVQREETAGTPVRARSPPPEGTDTFRVRGAGGEHWGLCT